MIYNPGKHTMGSHPSGTNTTELAICPSASQCGRTSCVTFLSGEHCVFCEPAKGMLRDLLSQFDVPFTCVSEIDVENDDIAQDENILALPTIKICDETIVGLPDEGAVRDAIVRALMNECFCI